MENCALFVKNVKLQSERYIRIFNGGQGKKENNKKMEDKREEERRRQEIENERKAKENETQELLLWKVLDHCLISSM